MSVRRSILAEELHLLRREGVANWVCAALILLVVAAAVNGRALLSVERARAADAVAEADETRLALAQQAARGVATALDPGALGYSVLSAPAVLPTTPLASLAVGQLDLLPGRFSVTARGAHHFLGATSLDNPLRLALGNFDVAFVIVWLLPLVVIALTFNLLSGERERGVLAIAAVAGAGLSQVIAVKVKARGVILLATLWAALLLAALIGGVPLAGGQAVLQWLLWAGAATLYGAFWFALAVWINTRGLASDLNASVLTGLWLLFVVLAPALTNLAATTAFAAPSRVRLTTELREATEAADRRAAGERDRYFFDHPDMRGQDMDQSAYYRSVARSEREIAAIMLPLLAEFETQAVRQQELVKRLQFLSPATLTYGVLTSLSGSDGARHRQLRTTTLAFHERWRDYFEQRVNAGIAMAPQDYANLPRFAFAEAALGATVRQNLAALAALAAIVAGLALWSARRLRRLPVVHSI